MNQIDATLQIDNSLTKLGASGPLLLDSLETKKLRKKINRQNKKIGL